MAAWWDDPRFAAPAPQPSSGLASLGSLAASPPSADVSGSLGDLSAPTRMGIPRLGASPTRAQLDQYFASLPDVPKPAAPPSPEKSPESAGYVGLGDLWKDVKWAAGQVVPSFRAAQAQLQEGPDPYAQRDAGDALIEQSRQATQQHLAELGPAENQTVIPLPFVNNITRGTLASLPQNLGFMGASLLPMESSAQLSGLAGAGAGAAAAAPLAAIPVVGPYLGGGGALAGAARGYFAGTGARAGYLMERDNAMRDYRAMEDAKARAMGNPPLTDQEWSANYASHYLPYAEQRAKNMAAIGAVQNAVAMPLVAGGAQRAVGGKFLQGAAEVAGGQAVQMGGMAATHIAQTQQDVRAGAQAGPEPSLWSPADWGHALKTVAPDVVALTAVAGAMGAATGRLRAALGKSTPEAEARTPGTATPETAAPKKLDLESLRATMALARPEDLVNALQSLGSVDAPGSSLTPGATARLEQARQRLTTELQQRVTPETLAQPLTTPLGEAGYLGLANRSNQLSDATLQAMATRELPADAPESWRAAQLAYQQESKDRAALADFPQQSDLPAKQRNAIIQRLLATTEGTPREGEYASPDYNLASLSNDALQHYQRAGEALLQDGNRPLSEGMRDRLETAVDALHAESDQRSAGVPRNPQEIRDQDVTGRLLALPPRRFQELLPTLAPPVLDRLSADLAGRSSLSPALELRAEWIRRQQTGTPAESAAPAPSPQESLRNEVSQINQQPPAPGERANAPDVTSSPAEITGPESRTEIPLSPSLENTHGETRQAETEALLSGQQQQPSTLRGITTQEIPLANLRLSEDVPQFKSDANPETGVVEPLGGKYERTGTAPIVVWERKNGQQEVISGRHRLDLARRSGEQTIPAQVLREADGFTAQKAAILDAELNIRDGQGKVKDYVNYFQHAGISPEEANLRGLVSRSIGKRAFTIANDGTESLLAAHRADVLSDDAAYRIAQSAPRDERLQAVGIKAIQSGKSIATATNLMQAVKSLGMADSALDMFGFDESAMRQAEDMARIAERHQRQIGEQLAAVQSAAKRPEAARKLGVDVANPEAVRARIAEMKQARDQWDTWSTNPDLVAQIRQEVDAEAKAKANQPRASAATGASANSAEMARAIAAHPDVQRLGDRILVVERQADLRPALQPKDGGPVKAVIDRGKIVLVGEHWTAQDLARMEGALQHEGGVHLARDSGFYDPSVQAAGKVLRAVGLKSLAGEASWNDVIHQFQALAKRPNSSAQRAYELARSALGAEARANPGLLHEEALGYLAELNPKHSLVLRLAAMVKATLYRMGVKVPLDESALVALTRAGLRSVAKEPMASDHAADPRYSRRTSTSPQQDSEYLAAAERGDMDVAQRMVDEAARRAGYTVEGFHGKRGEWGFTVFNTTSEGGAHFGTLAQAEMRGGKGNARRFFLKADSPARLRDTGEFKRIPKGKSSAIYLNRYEGISAETVSKIPGSVLDRMSDAEFRRAVPEAGDSTLVRNAWQIKSADPITRDDSGNIIPLSQRFDKSTADIRYSRAILDPLREKGSVARNRTPTIAGDKKEAAKTFSSIDEIANSLEEHGNLFVRWSGGEKYDTKLGAKSRDYVSGSTHIGLSAVPIDKDMSKGQIATRLKEYGFLRINDRRRRPFIYKAEKIGVDTDGYDLISNPILIGKVTEKMIRYLDNGLADYIKTKERLDDAKNRLPRISGLAAELTKKDIDKYQKELGELSEKLAKVGYGKDKTSDPVADGVIRYSRPHTWADNLPPEVASMADKIGAQPKGLLDRLREMRGTLPTRLRAGMVDRFARLLENDRQRFGRDVIDTQTELSSWVAAKMSKSAEGAMEGAFLHGRLKWENGALNVQETHKGLSKVLEPVASAGELNRFWQWIIANRSERLLREGRERLFTPAEIAAGKQLDAGTMADGANRSTVYQQAFARYVALQKSVLDVAQQAGLFNAQQRAQWEHDFYLPFYRVIENEGEVRGPSTGGGKLVRQKAFEILKGGTEKLGDPLQNILRNWHHLIDASLKNRAATLALDTARHLGIADVVPSTKTDKNSVWVMKDGQKTHYNVSDPLTLEAISSLNSPLMDGSAIRALSAVKRALTVGVTISPAFKIANLLRDSISALATSRLDANLFKLKPLTNPLRGFLESKEGGYSPGSLRAKLYSALGADTTGAAQAALMTGGGTFHFGTILEGDTNAAARRIAGWQPDTVLDSPAKLRGLFDAVKSGLDAWNRFGDRLETANRTALYTQLRQEGKTHLQAALAARDLMDFSQAGGWPAMRFLVNMVPFLNARVQGLDVLYRKGVQPMTRALRGAASDSEKQQALRFATTTFMVGLASSLLYLHYKDDHEFKAREQWDRDSYWWFKIGGKAYRIPKPFEVGALGTIAERLIEQIFDHEATGKLFADRMKAMLSQTFAFDPTPQLVKPLLDVYANRDSFTGRPIETLDMERLSPELRRRYNTSALAVGLSQAGLGKAGISPVQIESLMRGYLGWIGAQSLMVGDLMARPALGLPTRPLKQSDIPLIGDLMQRFAPDGRGSRYVTEFYDQLKQIQQVAADAQLFTKLQDPKALQELVKGHGQELARAKPMEAVARELALLGQAERLIANDRNLSATEKQARIDALSQNKAVLAQQAMAALRIP